MGMAASQGRLLMMTARISNNEFEQQCVAYSKQRLADESQQANDQYLDALQATQYQILTGYQGDSAVYAAVSYDTLTGFDNASANKQYIVTDNVGKILVSNDIEKAFKDADFDFNKFLENVEKGKGIHYTQIPDMDITEGMVHDVWDRYLTSVNKGHVDGIYDDNDPTRHAIGFAYNHEVGKDQNGDTAKDADGNIVYVDFVSYSTKYLSHVENGVETRIYLMDGVDDQTGLPVEVYENYKLDAESYIDENGETKYVPYFISTDSAQGQEMKVYLYDYTAEPNNNGGFDFKDLDGNIIKDKAGHTLSSGTNQNVYVNRAVYIAGTNENQSSGTIEFTGTFQEVWESNTGNFSLVTNPSTEIYYEGSTPEQRELYDYAMALTKKYANQYAYRGVNSYTCVDGFTQNYELTYDADKVQYYKNIYDQMVKKGYTTYEKMTETNYIGSVSNPEVKPFSDDEWLVRNIKNGKLVISFYSSTEKDFIKTTLDDDESIVNKEDKSKMAIAEQVYQSHMDKIQYEDKRYDMELTKLESEHTALLTEYESVNKVISKNVEKSFGTFNA